MGARWDDDEPGLVLTYRGAVVAIAVAFLGMWAAAAIGEALWPTPPTSSPSDSREVSSVEDYAWVTPSQVTLARGDVPRGASSRASRSHRALPSVLRRIRWCESRDDYRAENPTSSASGAFQITRGTWGRFRGYPTAVSAPHWVQDEKALALYLDRGTQPWNASKRCWS